eukprot:jgi/Mesen1/10763/ME000091S10293
MALVCTDLGLVTSLCFSVGRSCLEGKSCKVSQGHLRSGIGRFVCISNNGMSDGSDSSGLFKGDRRLQVNRLRLKAMQADDRPPSEMTFENALKLLGVGEAASFDEILRAKRRILDSSSGDPDFTAKVESAYDILLMQSLSRRRAGKGVDSKVRFADVRQPKASGPPAWLAKALSGAPVAVATPSGNALPVQAAAFAGLAAWTFASGLNQGEIAVSTGADVPGLQLAVGFGCSLYFLRQENVKLGKASLLTAGGVAAGCLLGSLVEAWLRVDLFPVLGISSPAVLVSEFTFLSLWLTSAYLR